MAAAQSSEGVLRRFEEPEQTLVAIRDGAMDAVTVHAEGGPRLFTQASPDQPFQTFVESMQEGAITLAADGRILYANAFFAAMVARLPSQLIGVELRALVLPDYEFTAQDLLKSGLSGTSKGTLRLRAGDDSIPVQLTLAPLTHGSEPTCCGVVFDLRERERVEKAHAAQQAAEQANAAKDRFLAILSHELRSPLNTVLGWAQILAQRADLDEPCRRAIQTIERSARVQAQMIADLLDISRIVAKKLQLELDIVDFKSVVESAVSAAALGRTDTSVELACELPELDVPVSGDAARLQQIVANLLNNAVKFTPSGGKIRVRLESADREAVLTVSDNGVGIHPGQLAHVFDPFRQAAADINHRKGGLGLGLAIARQLAEAHGGRVDAHSDGPGCGSSFTVRLPQAPVHVLSPVEGAGPGAELREVRVLVVDDEADTLELTRYLLESAGAFVETADSAPAALALLDSRRFDVLVSDIGLPEQDGHALVREVRARGHTGHTLPAIALTGYATSADATLCAAAGFQMHLAKPVDARELVRSIARLAATRQGSYPA
jgi:PAS domain S-box-containing protein